MGEELIEEGASDLPESEPEEKEPIVTEE